MTLVGVIPAAGRGVRAYPYTQTIPKSMLEIDGVPLIRRNVELMRDRMGIRKIRIVIGHHGEVIRDHLGTGDALGVEIEYIENDRLALELGYSVFLGVRGVESHAVVLLADECYIGTNHDELVRSDFGDALAVCGMIQSPYAKHIRKNYTVTLDGDRVTDLHEKPTVVTGNLMGTGTFLLSPRFIQLLESAFAGDPARGPRDFISWVGQRCREGVDVRAFVLSGSYVNVNSRDDLNWGNYLLRELSFEKKKTSLVYVVDGEEERAARPVDSFAERPEIDEVIVVTRRMTPALLKAGSNAKVRLLPPLPEETPIGQLFITGLDAASGDILMTSYSDDTFSARDVAKMLVYLKDADLVVGTRTTRQMIEQGTNMRGLVRAVHLFLAKVLEMLWWRFDCRFTDVCCVYRAMWRSTYRTIRGNLTASGVEVIAEMVIEVLRARRRIIEIPVNYYNRDLEFDYVRSRYQNVGTFLRILGLMLRKRFSAMG